MNKRKARQVDILAEFTGGAGGGRVLEPIAMKSGFLIILLLVSQYSFKNKPNAFSLSLRTLLVFSDSASAWARFFFSLSRASWL
jgi:hypothetical protein